MPSEPTVVAERYQLLRKLGAGPVGQVWEGHDRVLDQPVAVKVVHPHLAADAAFRALARPGQGRSPGPAPQRGHRPRPRRGRTLRRRRAGGGAQRPSAARRGARSRPTWPSGSGSAPAPLSVPPTPPASSTGTSSRRTSSSPPTAASRSPTSPCAADPNLTDARYLAPEELQTGRGDDRSDLYALGCCLYEMVTGQPPFDGPTPFAVAAGHLSGRPGGRAPSGPTSPSSSRRSLPPPWPRMQATASRPRPSCVRPSSGP